MIFSRLFPHLIKANSFLKHNVRNLATNNPIQPTISYQLPELMRPSVGIVGDKTIHKNPILDSKTNGFAIFGSVANNNSISILDRSPFDLTELDLTISNIMNGIMNDNNRNLSYELPNTSESRNIEKLADYYKHKDPKRFSHLLWVRHRAMKKHQRIKWRKKNLAMIKRRLLERNIKKEKQFRAELLAQIREAENFDPKMYVENILKTIDNVPKRETPQEKLERYRDLIRKNRTQTNLISPKFED